MKILLMLCFTLLLFGQQQQTRITVLAETEEKAKKKALTQAIEEMKGVYVKSEFTSATQLNEDDISRSSSKKISMMSLAYAVKISDVLVRHINGEVNYTATFSFDDPKVFKEKKVAEFSGYISNSRDSKKIKDKIYNLYKSSLIAEDMHFGFEMNGKHVNSAREYAVQSMNSLSDRLSITAKKFYLDDDKTVIFADLELRLDGRKLNESLKIVDVMNGRNYRSNRFTVLVDSVKYAKSMKFKKFKIRLNTERYIKKLKNEQMTFLNGFMDKDIKQKFDPIINTKLNFDLNELIAAREYESAPEEPPIQEPIFVKKKALDIEASLGISLKELNVKLNEMNRKGLIRIRHNQFKYKSSRVNIMFCFDGYEKLSKVIVSPEKNKYQDYLTGENIDFDETDYTAIIYTQSQK